MEVEVKYFGMIAEALERTHETLHIDTSSEINVKEFFQDRYPELKKMSYSIAIDQEIKTTLTIGSEVKEIALLPPFAGG